MTGRNDANGRREIVCVGNLFVVSARVSDGRTTAAWSTGRMLHDMNALLGSTAAEAPDFSQRPSCLCNAGHALAIARALEDMAGVRVPPAARLVRGIVQSLQYLSDHLAHFYVFHLGDWLNLGRALEADPAATARLAEGDREPGEGRTASPEFFAREAGRLAELARGEAGAFFAVGDRDHPAYAGAPEAHLLVFSHADGAAGVRADLARTLKLLRCDGSGHPAYRVGGLADGTTGEPGDAPPDLSTDTLERCAGLLRGCRVFIEETFLPDALLIARLYPLWARLAGVNAFLAWPEFPGAEGPALLPGGVCDADGHILDSRADPERACEEPKPAWPAADAERYRLHLPPEEPAYRWDNARLEWFSAPRVRGRGACEVGPLARIVAARAAGGDAGAFVDGTLGRAGLPPAALNSALGRLLARGMEAVLLARATTDWLDALRRLPADSPRRAFRPLPDGGEGEGLAEIPRGALLHRVRMEAGHVVRHESIVPSLWNFSPRDGAGAPGPLELALAATPVADPTRPLELLRTVHAFDPCNACMLRVEDSDTGRTLTVDAK